MRNNTIQLEGQKVQISNLSWSNICYQNVCYLYHILSIKRVIQPTLCLCYHTCLIILIELLICGLEINDTLRLKIYSMLYTYAYSTNNYCLQFLFIIVISQDIVLRLLWFNVQIFRIHHTDLSLYKVFLPSKAFQSCCRRKYRNSFLPSFRQFL